MLGGILAKMGPQETTPVSYYLMQNFLYDVPLKDASYFCGCPSGKKFACAPVLRKLCQTLYINGQLNNNDKTIILAFVLHYEKPGARKLSKH